MHRAIPRVSPARRRFLILLTSLTLTLATLARPGTAGAARGEIDRSAPAPDVAAARTGAAPDARSQLDARTGVPSFLWADAQASAIPRSRGPRPAPEQMARTYLASLAARYGLTPGDVDAAVLRDVHDTGRGGIVVTFTQRAYGIDVFREQTRVLMDRNQRLIAVSGSLPSIVGAPTPAAFTLDARAAVGRALDDYAAAPVERGAIGDGRGAPAGFMRHSLAATGPALPAGLAAETELRSKPVYFRLPDRLEPAWYVEVLVPEDAGSYVVSAVDGGLLFRHALTAFDAFSYRVWADGAGNHSPLDGPQGNGPTPHPTGTPGWFEPAFVPPSLVTLQNGPISTNDPWLPPGATETAGNNVAAFLSGGAPAPTTAPGVFDHLYDLNADPLASPAQGAAAVTEAFYTTNFLHDWFYDVGFDEAAGNGQVSNYGRGGVEGDGLLVEVQESGQLNNANMTTPADGGSPHMRNYLWQSGPTPRLKVDQAVGLPPSLPFGGATFNAPSFSVSGALVRPRISPLTLGAPQSVGFSANLIDLEVADINHDGIADLLVSAWYENAIFVSPGTGGGGFGPPVAYAAPGGCAGLWVGDLYGDGFPDIAVANNAAASLSLWANIEGFPDYRLDLPTSSYPMAVVLADLNGDGLPDIVNSGFLAYPQAVLSVFLTDPEQGILPRVDYPCGSQAGNVVVRDIDGDGKLDLVTSDGSSISILRGLGDGTFAPRTEVASCNPGDVTSAFAVGDLNHDGHPDLVAANNGDPATFRVLVNDGSGGFVDPQDYPLYNQPHDVKIGDVDGDGDADLVLAGYNLHGLLVVTGVGDGTFDSEELFPNGADPVAVALADVDQDGLPELVAANDGDQSVTIQDAGPFQYAECGGFPRSVEGRILFVEHSGCGIDAIMSNAQVAGAAAVVIAEPNASTAPTLTAAGSYSIPAYSVAATAGTQLAQALARGEVKLTLVNAPVMRREGALDNQIVAHEWGHYLSNRLIGDGNGLTGLQAAGMGEGWSDFVAMLMTVRPEDAALPGNEDFSRPYSVSGYAASTPSGGVDTYYFGIRRYPYSTDLGVNPLTFGHIQDSATLPAGPPVNDDGNPNSEVHNSGVVWCSMLWECYAALLNDTGRLTFDQARDRMRGYLVASLKLTPVAPTFLDARDALLAAAYASDPVDYALFWAAFAKRGMGIGAVAPPASAPGNEGVVESFVSGGELQVLSMTLLDDVHSCDSDGILDTGETGTLTVTLKNVGAATLTGTTVALSSPSAGVQLPGGTSFDLPASTPYGTTSVSVPVALGAVSGLQQLSIEVHFDDPALAVPGPRLATFLATGNADVGPATTEDFESGGGAWTAGGEGPDASGAWQIETETNGNHRFHAADPESGPTDFVLTSPPIDVGSDPFSFTFHHAYSFEFSDGIAWDGGVVELSTDDGANWTDIGATITPGYDAVLSNEAGNPLGDRPGFAGTSADYPAMTLATVSLGTAYAGQTVRIRFRCGADGLIGAPGWWVDDLAFTGITNAPFLALVPESDPCAATAVSNEFPKELGLAIVGANPSPGGPTFRFALPAPARVDLAIFDVSGRRVASLVDGERPAGIHEVHWSGGAVGRGGPAGIYFARLVAGNRTLSRKVVVLAP